MFYCQAWMSKAVEVEIETQVLRPENVYTVDGFIVTPVRHVSSVGFPNCGAEHRTQMAMYLAAAAAQKTAMSV